MPCGIKVTNGHTFVKTSFFTMKKMKVDTKPLRRGDTNQEMTINTKLLFKSFLMMKKKYFFCFPK